MSQYGFQEQQVKKYGKYSFISTLGSGSEGDVFKVSYKKEFFALKRSKRILKPEIFEIYAKIAENENLVSFIEQFTFNGDMCLIFEFCNEGTLQTFNYHTEEQIIKFLRDICNGYKELYKNCIIHRDIKPDNILCHNGVYKIADFGFARFVLNPQLFQDLTKKHTPIYAAPQLLKACQFSSKCDIWSLGLVLYELIYQKMLMGKCRSYDEIKEIQQQIKTGKLIYPETHIQNKQLINLVKSMIQYSESDRICWDTIFSHQIITDFKIMMEPIEDADQLKGKTFFMEQFANITIFEEIFKTLQNSRDIMYLLQIWCNYLNVLSGQLLGQIVIKPLVISQALFIKTDLSKQLYNSLNSILEFLQNEQRFYLIFEKQKHSLLHQTIKKEQIEFFENIKILELIKCLKGNQKEVLAHIIQDQLNIQ